jgi:hypothetical protein
MAGAANGRPKNRMGSGRLDPAGSRGERMNGTLSYLFFFSYSRSDYDRYLDKFFADLEEQVASVGGAGTSRLGFRDEDGVKTGDDWTRKISAAVQTSHVLVCIYTPNFFSKVRTHEFCAKEFMAFLERDPRHRYERVVDEGNCERYEVREARNILPILWRSKQVLVDVNNLPPYALRTIQWTLDFPKVSRKLKDQYKEKGMWLISKTRRGTYWEILNHLAIRIVELGACPLPSKAPPPDIRTLRNAFWDDPPEMSAARGAPVRERDADSLDDAAIPSLSTKQLVAFEVRSALSGASAWAPYPGEPSLRALVEEIAQSRQLTSRYRTFDPSADDFVTALLAALQDATEKRVLPILFIDPKALARPEWRKAVASLLREPWRGGIVFPVDATDQPSIHFMESVKSEFKMTPDEREWIVFMTAPAGSVAELRMAVISVATGILARIVTHGSVERNSPATGGPSVPLPRIANT